MTNNHITFKRVNLKFGSFALKIKFLSFTELLVCLSKLYLSKRCKSKKCKQREKNGYYKQWNEMDILDNRNGNVNKIIIDYVTIWINDSGRGIVDAFATENVKWHENFCIGIYCDILGLIIYYYVKLEATRSILKNGNLGK